MLSVTETNHGLAYDRDVKVSFETFYDVIFVSMLSKTLHDLNFLKVGNILHFLREL